MKKLHYAFIAMLAIAFSCQLINARGWHWNQKQLWKMWHKESKDSVIDTTFHHKGHNHTDSLDYDSIFKDSVLIYHHCHKHFKNDTVPYDSLKHDSSFIKKHSTITKEQRDSLVKATRDSLKAERKALKQKIDSIYKEKKRVYDSLLVAYWNKVDSINKANKKNPWNWKKPEPPTKPVEPATPDTFFVDNVLFIDSMSVTAGTSQVVMPIMLDNQNRISAFQFRISLPDGITFSRDTLNNLAVEKDGTRCPTGKIYAWGEKDGEITFQYYTKGSDYNYWFFDSKGGSHFKSDSIVGNEGAVAYITLNIADTLAAGEYTIEMTGVKLKSNGEWHRGYTSCSALTIASPAKEGIFDFGTPTVVNTVNAAANDNDAYFDLNGRKVSALKAGEVYIHQGKKIMK